MRPLFLHIPKTAGTFLSGFFASCAGVYIQGHAPLSEVGNLEDYFVFAFIRNPWDWYVSRFAFYLKLLVDPPFFVPGMTGNDFMRGKPSFKEHLLEGVKYDIDNFWLSQKFKMMCFKDGAYSVDYMGHFEDIEGSVSHIIESCDLKPLISFENFCKRKDLKSRRNSTEHAHYSEYYDDELIELVTEKDKEIIEKFSYSYEQI